jgi:hypothetical protein
LSKKDVSRASASKLKISATKKKKTAGRMVKLKSSSWYEGAARSLGISKGKLREKSDERID